MKKAIIAGLVSALLCICMGACSNNESPDNQTTNKLDMVQQLRIAEQLEDDIEALILGPDIEDELNRIQEAYDSLSSEAQDEVDNYDDFLDLRADFDAAMKAVDEAIDAIENIGEVDENSMSRIDEAQSLLDAINPLFADLVTNAAEIDEARSQCRQAISDKGVEETQALIDAGKYQQAYNYASDYLFEHSSEMGSQTELTAAMQTAELYWGWELYNTNYLGYVQDIIDDLEYDSVTDDIAAGVSKLQSTLDAYLASVEPANGSILASTIGGGYGELVINSGSMPILVKIEGYGDPSRYIYMYLRPNSTATFNVPDGYYIVKYATGDKYFGDTAAKPFGSDTTYRQADDIMEFSTTQSGNYIYYDIVTLTLYAVEGGNLPTTEIDGF